MLSHLFGGNLMTKKASAEATVRKIRRNTHRKYSAEEKTRLVLEGIRGDQTIAELCRREGINKKPVLSLEQGLSRGREIAPYRRHKARSQQQASQCFETGERAAQAVGR
jgi:transposase